jgi:hypothetical protein
MTEQTMIYKTLHKKTKYWARQILHKPGMNSGVIYVLKKLHELNSVVQTNKQYLY